MSKRPKAIVINTDPIGINKIAITIALLHLWLWIYGE